MAEVSTIARPYAKAAFEHATEASELAQWSEALATAAVVSSDPDMRRLLDSPSLGNDAKAVIFIDICADSASDGVKNFITVLAENKRLAALPAISQAFEVLKAQKEQAVDVEVISAFELTTEQQDMLARKLKNKWQKEVSIKQRVDDSLIGGVVIRAGDLVIDDSIRGKLMRLTESVNT